MSKIFQKLKKWISSLTAVVLLVSIITPAIAFAAAPVVTITDVVTNDTTPALSGSVDDPTAVVSVNVDGNDYAATNLGTAWNLADDTIAPALSEGTYAVTVTATNIDGTDVITGSLIVDLTAPILAEVVPVVGPTNNLTPSYQFSSTEAGSLSYGGSCVSGEVTAVGGLNAIAFGPLAEGVYSDCEIYVTDEAGNTSLVLPVSSFEVDITAPEVTGVTNGGHYNADIAPTFTEGTGILKYSGNTVPFVSGTAISDEDVYVLEVTDVAGNTATVVFTIDKTAPVITLNGDNPLTVERGTSYTDPGATTDSGEGVVPSGSVDTSAIGDYVISYNATDAAGNAAVTVTRDVLVRDTMYPRVDAGVDQVVNAPVFQDASADDGEFSLVSRVWSQDSGVGTAFFGPDQFREDVFFLADADDVYTIRFTVTDAAGNESWDTADITWDTTEPAVSSGGDVYANSAFIQDGSATDNLSGVVSYQWSVLSGPGIVVFGDSNLEDTSITADTDGVYVIDLAATDAAGNTGHSQFTLTWDTVAPVVSDVSVTLDFDSQYVDGLGGYELRANVSDELSGINTLSCEYTVDGVNYLPATYDALNEECYVSGLTATDSESLALNIRVEDRAGNQNEGAGLVRIADELAPVVSPLVVYPTSGAYTSANPTLIATATDAASYVASCEYRYSADGGSWTRYESMALNGGQWEVSLADLVSGSSYDFGVVCTDAVGHISSEQTTTRIVDNTRPVIFSLPDVVTRFVTTSINATTSDEDSGIATWSWTVESQPAGSGVIFSAPGAEDTDVTVDTDGQYILRLTVVDNVGSSTFAEMTLTLDRAVPVVGQTNVFTDFNPYVDGLSFNAWAPAEDLLSGISGCEYTIDNGLNWNRASYDGGNCHIENLTAPDGSTVSVNLRATDVAGNVGSGSSITRTADALAPTISGLVITPDFGGYVSQNPSVSVSVADSVSYVAGCEYDYRQDGGLWIESVPAALAGSSCSFDLSNLADGSMYDITIRAFDGLGHASSISFTRTVDGTKPVVDAGLDQRSNKAVTLDATASDVTSGIATYSWTQVSGPGTLSFTSANTEDTDVSADKHGVYVAQLAVTDNVGNVSYDKVTIDWDVKVGSVSELKAVAGDKETELSWKVPADKDLASLKVYRSTKSGEKGTLLATLVKDATGFVDLGLLNSTTYYYTVVTVDDLGNSASSLQVFATPEKQVVSTVLGQNDDKNVKAAESKSGEGQEVKSDETEKTDEGAETSSSVSTVGIIILILLIALGLYLLYLQNPEMFGKLAFWKRNKKGSITLPVQNKERKTKNSKTKKRK